MSRRSLHALLLLVLAGLSLLWLLQEAPQHEPRGSEAASGVAERKTADAAQAPAVPAAAAPSPEAAKRVPDAAAAAPAAPLAAGAADPARHRRAYVLSLDGATLSLVSRQDMEGDFRPRRSEGEELWPGMLRCRLVSATGAVLAEEVMPAPDQLCGVQDRGKLVTFRVAGPVIFQARLPRVADAARLEVSRISARDAAAPDVPVGSIALNP